MSKGVSCGDRSEEKLKAVQEMHLVVREHQPMVPGAVEEPDQPGVQEQDVFEFLEKRKK